MKKMRFVAKGMFFAFGLSAFLPAFALDLNQTATVDGIEWTYYVLQSGTSSRSDTYIGDDGNLCVIMTIGGGSNVPTKAPAIDKSTTGAITVPILGNEGTSWTGESIGPYAFYECAGITSVTVPEGVTAIHPYAFMGCSNLVSVTLPSTLKKVERYAFQDCISLAEVNFSPSSSPSIDSCAFLNCRSLVALRLPDNASFASNAARICDGCASLREVNIPSNLPTGYSNNSGLWKALGSSAFCVTNVVFGPKVTSIPAYACEKATNLVSVTIPSSVGSIGERAFVGCKRLKGVTVPSSVDAIGDWAFRNCVALETAVVEGGKGGMGESLFCNCHSLRTVEIPQDLTALSDYMFWSCTNLVSITLPPDIKEIPKYAFNSCKSLKTIDIPSGVTNIAEYAFYDCRSLESVGWPSGLKAVETYAFSRCKALWECDLADGVETLGSAAFAGAGVTKVKIPDSITSLGGNVFVSCPIADIDTGDGVTDFSALASLIDSGSLTNIVMGSGMKEIPAGQFQSFRKLKSVTVGPSVTNIGANAFNSCAKLERVSIPEGVQSFGQNAFRLCGLATLTVPLSVTSMGADALFNTSLKRLYLPRHFQGATSGIVTTFDCEIIYYGDDSATSTEVPIPYSWLKSHPTSMTACGNDYETLATSTAANGRKWWECYAADLDPEDPDDDLEVGITMVNGVPQITIINGESDRVTYRTLGAKSLDGAWSDVTNLDLSQPANADYRFFKIEVVVN